ncbi:hypothetical protein D7319_00670 [Streptomyces radicis]|uniref:Uncharacterized protein n=1 Tax=Streptomyces radicis TaxID=1750517 RepID=A0A3A9WIU1_9ACTN|nr:hypothetical protein D7319_00670 [Streptomyces radicis]
MADPPRTARCGGPCPRRSASGSGPSRTRSPCPRGAAAATVDHLGSRLGEDAWRRGMNPEVADTGFLDNPYTYTDFRTAATHGG